MSPRHLSPQGSGAAPPAARQTAGSVVQEVLARRILARRGELVRARRAALGLSQGQLARLAGLDQSTISGIELGKHDMSARRAARLAPVLDVSVEALLVGATPVTATDGGLEAQVILSRTETSQGDPLR